MILNRTCNDFRRASRTVVKENDQRHFRVWHRISGEFLVRVPGAPSRGYDHLAAADEFVGYFDRLIKVSS